MSDDGSPKYSSWRDQNAMDDETLKAAYHAHADGQPKFTRRMAIIIADMAEMRPMSLIWRLEKMGLLKSGAWDWFKSNGGITQAQIKEVREAQPHDQ